MMNPIHINDVERAVTAAKQILKLLAAKYESGGLFKELKPWLVFSSRLGQVEIDAPFEKQITEFPEMFVDDSCKVDALEIVMKIKASQRGGGGKELQSLSTQLAKLKNDVSYLADVTIALRFTSLVFELIWLLQQDPLIDRDLTPTRKASIRVVVGTIGNLSKC